MSTPENQDIKIVGLNLKMGPGPRLDSPRLQRSAQYVNNAKKKTERLKYTSGVEFVLLCYLPPYTLTIYIWNWIWKLTC